MSSGADVELEAIRGIIEVFETVSSFDDVLAVLHDRSQCDDSVELLDVIGHSRAEGFLVLGTWVVDDSPQTAAAFSELLRPALERLGVQTIRLLGCSTAATELARNAMCRISRASGCEVLGTRRYVGRRDYGQIGFLSDETLVGSSSLDRYSRRSSTTQRNPRS